MGKVAKTRTWKARQKKTKKGFNWKARQDIAARIVDHSGVPVTVELPGRQGHYDEANPLVLPSVKRQTEKSVPLVGEHKLLSKKQRKRLEKIVERKEKKEQRAGLLQALSAVQQDPRLQHQLTSTSAMHSQGNKPKIRSLRGAKIFRQNRLAATSAQGRGNSEQGDPRDAYISRMVSSSEDSSDDEDMEKTDLDEIAMEGSLSEKNEVELVEGTTKLAVPATVEHEATKVVAAVDAKVDATKSRDPDRRAAVYIPVRRTKQIEAVRLKLPILMEEQSIMEKIRENDVVILCGETGSGKTTQVPQFLYEAGYAEKGLIGITEPRRVAAVSMARRVAEEMSLGPDIVSYQIRFEGNVCESTRIKFMTDGVLLREIQQDFLLTKYSVIILDEAHERSVNTDVVLGLLSRILPIRKKRGTSCLQPLKLIIMSATLRVEDFTENRHLFKTVPVVSEVDTRRFSVTVHFNKRTPEDYCDAAFRKIGRIHTTLPDGGILVFVTGQQEVRSLCRRLMQLFPKRRFASKNKEEDTEKDDDGEEEQTWSKRKWNRSSIPRIDLDEFSEMPYEGGTDLDLEGDEDDMDDDMDAETDEEFVSGGRGSHLYPPLHVLPLFSMLPPDKQAQVFQAPPDGTRLCVVATNVAETSLTIPHVKYVVDSGKVKTRVFDKVTGVSTFQVTWISKASAEQRAGRAGRTSPGHCYRLYSSSVFNNIFPEFSIPEIQLRPVDDLILQLKVMDIHKAVGFPFPSPPDRQQMEAAEEILAMLGAIEKCDPSELNGRITSLGRFMSFFPVAPRFAKMLAMSHQHGLMGFVIALVAAFSVPEVLLEQTPIPSLSKEDRKRLQTLRKKWGRFGSWAALGDAGVLLRAALASELFLASEQSSLQAENNLEKFCLANGLRSKAVKEIRKLRVQLTNLMIQKTVHEVTLDPRMLPPSAVEAKLLCEILCTCLPDHVARRVNESELHTREDKAKWKGAYRAASLTDPIFIHPSSVLKDEAPEWIVYLEIIETSKIFARGIISIEAEWLPRLAAPLCRFSEPLSEPAPRYDEAKGNIMATFEVTFGKIAWELPLFEAEYPLSVKKFQLFAQFFLEGLVCPSLARYVPLHLFRPSSLVKWCGKSRGISAIVQVLASAGVSSKKALVEKWQQCPKFLLNEYCQWVPRSYHGTIALSWPPERVSSTDED